MWTIETRKARAARDAVLDRAGQDLGQAQADLVATRAERDAARAEARRAERAANDATAALQALDRQHQAGIAQWNTERAALIAERDEAMELARERAAALALLQAEKETLTVQVTDLHNVIAQGMAVIGAAVSGVGEARILNAGSTIMATGLRTAPLLVGHLVQGYTLARAAKKAVPQPAAKNAASSAGKKAGTK